MAQFEWHQYSFERDKLWQSKRGRGGTHIVKDTHEIITIVEVLRTWLRTIRVNHWNGFRFHLHIEGWVHEIPHDWLNVKTGLPCIEVNILIVLLKRSSNAHILTIISWKSVGLPVQCLAFAVVAFEYSSLCLLPKSRVGQCCKKLTFGC